MRRTIIFQCSAHIQTIVIFFFLSQQVNTEKYIHPLLLLLLWLWLCSNRKITIWTPGFFFFLFFLMEGGNNINRAADDCCLVSIFTSVEFFLLFKLRYIECWFTTPTAAAQQQPPTWKLSCELLYEKMALLTHTILLLFVVCLMEQQPTTAASSQRADGSWPSSIYPRPFGRSPPYNKLYRRNRLKESYSLPDPLKRHFKRLCIII